MITKKVLAVLALVFVFSAGSFAQEKTAYKVQSVSGKVSVESSDGNWISVTSGMTIDSKTKINTGIKSTITLLVNDEPVTIKQMKKGVLGDLLAESASKTVVKGSAKIAESEVKDVEKSSKSVVTAASRASEAKDDVEWED